MITRIYPAKYNFLFPIDYFKEDLKSILAWVLRNAHFANFIVYRLLKTVFILSAVSSLRSTKEFPSRFKPNVGQGR